MSTPTPPAETALREGGHHCTLTPGDRDGLPAAPELRVHTGAGLLLSLHKLSVTRQALTVFTVQFSTLTCKQERIHLQHNATDESSGTGGPEHPSSSQEPSPHPSHPAPALDQATPAELSCISQHGAGLAQKALGDALQGGQLSRATSTCTFSAWRPFLFPNLFICQTLSLAPYPQAGTGHWEGAAQGKANRTFFSGMGFAQSCSTATFPRAPWDAPSNGLGLCCTKRAFKPFLFFFLLAPQYFMDHRRFPHLHIIYKNGLSLYLASPQGQ